MKYQKAETLGQLQRQLGISPDARVLAQIMTDGPFSAYVWDLETGDTYVMIQGRPINPINVGPCEVPHHVKSIIACADDDLRNRWFTSEGWNELRETVSSELAFRGIKVP
jgi:hypothetical protein